MSPYTTRIARNDPSNPSLAVFQLPPEVFDKVTSLDRNARYNFPARYGVDVFGDADPDVMKKAVEEFRAKQKQLRGVV